MLYYYFVCTVVGSRNRILRLAAPSWQLYYVVIICAVKAELKVGVLQLYLLNSKFI